MNIQEEIIKYCEKHNIATSYCSDGVSLSKICHGKDEKGNKYDNPFPIGRKNLYLAFSGKPISKASYCKMVIFFQELNNDKQCDTAYQKET